jgi:hypothetical protein
MEEQPSIEPTDSQEPTSRQRRIAGLSRRLFVLLAVSLFGAVLFAAVIGPQNLRGFSDGLFIIGAALLIIGLLPLFADIFNRSTVTFRRRERSFQDVLDEERERSQQNDNVAFLLGIAGTIIIVLSLILGFSVQ